MAILIEPFLVPLESCAWVSGDVGSSLVTYICSKFLDLYGGFGGGDVFVWVAFLGGEG